MTQQGYLKEIEADERDLRQRANTVSEEEYQKLVAHHLHLIAEMKEAETPPADEKK